MKWLLPAFALYCAACQTAPEQNAPDVTDQALLALSEDAVRVALRGDDSAEASAIAKLRPYQSRVSALLSGELQKSAIPDGALRRWALTRTLAAMEGEDTIRALGIEAQRVGAPVSDEDLSPFAALAGLEHAAARGSVAARETLVALLHHPDSSVRSAAVDSMISVDANWARDLRNELPPEERHFVYRKSVLETLQGAQPRESTR